MNDIALPKKVDYKEGEKPNQGIISVEPCYPGYGITLGNSLRRVLLSSLPGAAAVGVKIKGADHEFMALPHVKEDVLDIILNLKQLRLKILEDTDEEIKLNLEAHGTKEVKAGDIEKNSAVEIANPDLKLATITDMAGNLSMEIFVSRGRGYRALENIEDKMHEHEIGYITMDSIFSPVISAGVHVENVRVGKMTNWDKLILDVTTDGTITPREAFDKSVEVLISQFSALVGREVEEKAPEIAVEEPAVETASEESEAPAGETAEAPFEKKKRGRPRKI
jgi:DNA-directed RNA polymerase subunit alpha